MAMTKDEAFNRGREAGRSGRTFDNCKLDLARVPDKFKSAFIRGYMEGSQVAEKGRK